MGALIRRKAQDRRAPPLFGSKSTISRFGERFRDGHGLLCILLTALLADIRNQDYFKVY